MKKKTNAFEAAIPKIEKIIGYSFRDKSLLTQAFTRTSFCNEHKGKGGEQLQSNEVLEFFGDGVLSVAIISLLMKEHTERYGYGIRTKLGEGDFSNIKSKLSDKKNLSETTKKLGLEQYLQIGEGDQKLGIKTEPSVMEDLFESIIGAIYIDCGMDIKKVTEVVGAILDTSLYTSQTPPVQSAKNALQEWCADKKRRLPSPVYKTLSEEGPDHKKVYERGVYIGERLVGRGKGKNQKLADAVAADVALTVLKNEDKKQTVVVKKVELEPKSTKPVPKAKPSERKAPAKAGQKEAPSRKSASKEQKPSTESKNSTRPETSGATVLLKAHALARKAATPTFKDLGQSEGKGGAEYRIECRFMGISAIGVSGTRLGARESAAGMIAKELKLGAKKKSASVRKRPVAKRK